MRNNFGLGVGSFAPPILESWNPGILESPKLNSSFSRWNLGIPFFKRALKFGSGGSGGLFWVKHRGWLDSPRIGLASHQVEFNLDESDPKKPKATEVAVMEGGEISVCCQVDSWLIFFATAHPELSSFRAFFAKKYISQSFTGKHSALLQR